MSAPKSEELDLGRGSLSFPSVNTVHFQICFMKHFSTFYLWTLGKKNVNSLRTLILHYTNLAPTLKTRLLGARRQLSFLVQWKEDLAMTQETSAPIPVVPVTLLTLRKRIYFFGSFCTSWVFLYAESQDINICSPFYGGGQGKEKWWEHVMESHKI